MNVVVSWKDDKGMKYHAMVIYNPDTGTTYYWRDGNWVKVTVKDKLMEELESEQPQ